MNEEDLKTAGIKSISLISEAFNPRILISNDDGSIETYDIDKNTIKSKKDMEDIFDSKILEHINNKREKKNQTRVDLIDKILDE